MFSGIYLEKTDRALGRADCDQLRQRSPECLRGRVDLCRSIKDDTPFSMFEQNPANLLRTLKPNPEGPEGKPCKP